MKTIELDKEITTLSGAKIMLTQNVVLTYRSALVSVCELFQGEPGSGESLRAYNLGLKVINAKDDIKLDKEEVDFLKQIVEKNRSFMAVVIGRLLEFINKFN